MTTGEWVSRMTYSANGRSNEFFRRMSVKNEAYSANENGEGAIRRMRPIRRMRGYSAELIQPPESFGNLGFLTTKIVITCNFGQI